MPICYKELFTDHQIQLPTHLNSQDEIPIASRFWAQGDVYMRREMELYALISERYSIPSHRIKVVEGDADRNSHILDCKNGKWFAGQYIYNNRRQSFDYGVLIVPEDDYGYLTHTGEHGSIALVPGLWRLWSQVEFSNSEIRRVVD